jgi:hypothetical protein
MKPKPQAWRRAQLCGGLVLVGLGIAAIHDLDHAATERIMPLVLRDLIWFGPAIALLGCLTFLRGFARHERWLTSRKVLVTGLVMLAVGVIGWLLASATDPGGDASWANGMVAIMFAIYAGLPGLFLTLASFVLRREETK